MNSYAKWPTPINIKVNNTNYELYTFADRYEDPKSAPEEIIVPADMGNVEIPDPVVDLDNLPEPRDRDNTNLACFFCCRINICKMLRNTSVCIKTIYHIVLCSILRCLNR